MCVCVACSGNSVREDRDILFTYKIVSEYNKKCIWVKTIGDGKLHTHVIYDENYNEIGQITTKSMANYASKFNLKCTIDGKPDFFLFDYLKNYINSFSMITKIK